ncbi:phosphate ABC transporter substrate-binding protein [Terrisporobacter mayombei]|uniref:Phosphate-binding protein n=1 Tax=Terrisporobacter mayombei TaxID=1541 RepID=A0ABY9Q6E7_9FIRM|nr:phosphate ABC transporter substrate-binding protein [Terrisporobacter mayombei]MCC3869043.1 phosphate ABC transporter substrate-binding protein [Terrisporobacter mayombei]WMT82824.1 Phosphate-binding protein PstS 1 [Terrisporobacter mayombei]
MFKKKIMALLCGAVMVSGLVVGCGSGNSSEGDASKITISGSTSVGPTMEVLAEAYQKNNDVKIEVQQVGSSAGIKNTMEGTSNLGMSSRDLKDEEAQSVEGTQIAIDGIAVVTNKNNKVQDLTVEQVKDIFTGKITNWKEVGGEDAQIVVVSREEGSGTRDGFQDILGFKSEELIKDAQISDGSGNVKSTVEGNENAIAYISFGYVKDGIKSVKIDGVEANDDNVVAGKYPISRPFLVVNKKDAMSDEAKSFVDFIMSEEGQNIVAKEGFIKAPTK